MTNLKHILILVSIILAFIVAIIVLNKCDSAAPTGMVKRDSTVVYLQDTNSHSHSTTNVYISNSYTTTPPANIDTAEIIRLFFTKNFCVDSLMDSLLWIKVSDSLFNNKNIWRNYQYRLLKPYQKIITVKETQTFTRTVNGFYAGPVFGFGMGGKPDSRLQSAGLELNYVTWPINYGIGYDLLNNTIQAKVLFKIK